MRLFKRLTSGHLFLILLELFYCVQDSIANQQHQRCFGDIFVSPDSMASLFQSSCKRCESEVSFGTIDPHSHILFLLPPWARIRLDDSDVMHPLVSLASIMYRRGFDITVFQVRDESCGFRREHVPDMIFSTLPCEGMIQPNSKINSIIETIHELKLCKESRDIPVLDSPFDGLDRSPPLINLLSETVPQLKGRPQVVVTESTYVAAALVGEKLGMPVVMLAQPTEVDLITERIPVWRGVHHFVESRKRSIVNGMGLMKMNMLRRALQLPALKMPSDYYKRATWVVVHPDYDLSRTLPYNAYAVRPIVTECIPCDAHLDTGNKMNVIVAPLKLDYASMRSVIRAIVVAKTSLQTQADRKCDEDEDSNDCQFYRLLSQITAVVLAAPNLAWNLPDVLPSYVTVESSHPIDTLARYPFTVAMISHCDANAHVTAAMSIGQICIEKNGVGMLAYDGKSLVPFIRANVDDIAEALLKSLIQQGNNKIINVASKNSAADLIARAAHLKTMNNNSEFSDDEVRFYLGQRKIDPPEVTGAPFKRIMLIIVAFVFVAFTAYVHIFMSTVKQETQIPHWRRQYRWIAPYMDDVDPAIFHFTQWLSNPDALHNRWDRGDDRKGASKHDSGKYRNGAAQSSSRKKKGVKKR